MNCDVNNLSSLSSCLRCLSDWQLSQIKTFLFCQWAQLAANTGTPAAPSAPDITLASTQNNIVITWVDGIPAGNLHEVWKSTDGTNFNLFTTVMGATNQATDATGMAAGNIWYYKIRSCNGTNCSAFTSIISASFNYTSPNVASISFPTLIRAFGFFHALGLAALTSISLPALKRFDGQADLSGNANLTTVTLTSLTTCGVDLFLGNNNITGAFALPALVSTGADLQLQGNANMTSISCPTITFCGGVLAFSSTGVTSVNFNALQHVVVQLQFNSLTALTTVSFPSLTAIDNDLRFTGPSTLVSVSLNALSSTLGSMIGSGNASLTTVSMPNAIFFSQAHIFDLSACALLAATINQILARGVASGCTTDDFELNLGTNAAPSGQGVADKATLIAAGNTVNTN